MKLKTHRLGLVFGLLLATPLVTNLSYAQEDGGAPPPPAGADAGPPPGPPGGGPGDKGPRGPRGGGAERVLTEEERAKLMAAREKIKGDSEVAAAMDAAKKAQADLAAIMDKKLLAADPSLQPILDKLKAAREKMGDRRAEMDGPGRGGPGRPGADRPEKPGKPEKDDLGTLTPAEKETLKTARAAAKDDPAVTAARGKVQAAATKEEKAAARKELQSALHDAMTKANPETASILEKISAEHKPDAVN